jgi:ABC-2 type transport system permease protein
LTSLEQSTDGSALRWRLAESLRLGWLEYRAVNPPLVVASTTVPRMVLQTLFFTLLGGVIAGPGQREYVFIGALALAMTTTNAIGVANVLVTDKQSATFWRIRTGRLPPAAVFFVRASPYPVVGFVLLLVAAVVVALITGLTGLAVDLVPLLGLYALISCSMTAAGLAASSLAVGKRADVLAANLLAYVMILTSGAIVPPGRLPWVDAIGSVLPIRHGLLAIRAALAGQPWVGQAIAELLVGVGWAGVAVAVIVVQTRRAHRNGHDDFD